MQKLPHNIRVDLVKSSTLYHVLFSKLSRYRGIHNAILIMKTSRQVFLQYINGSPIKIVDVPLGISKDGLPKFLNIIKKHLEGEHKIEVIRLVLTLLSLTKMISLSSEPDYTPIVSEYSGEDLFMFEYEFRSFLPLLLKERAIPFWTEFHMSLKRGPNRGLAIHDSLKDLSIIKESKVYDSLIALGGQQLAEHIISHLRANKMTPGSGDVRKITSFPDKEGKIRNICIADYWTQTVLRPYHQDLMEILKDFKGDRTFDQGNLSYLLGEKEFYNFDLSDATDRFPVKVQKLLFEFLYSPALSDAWVDLLTSLPFRTPKGDYIHYRTGQPLGLYSSWPAFALSHHLIVQFAANQAGQNLPFTRYALLGDDIVICDKETASNYHSLMTQTLGVKISKLKTVTGPKILSFASRYYYEGIEVSPFTLSGLIESSKDPSQLSEFLLTMYNHGWKSVRDLITAPDLFRSLVSPFFKNYSRLRKVHRYETKLLFDIPMKLIMENGLTTPSDFSGWEWFQLIRCSNSGQSKQLFEIIAILLYDEIQKAIDVKQAPYVEAASFNWKFDIKSFYQTPGLGVDHTPIPSIRNTPFGILFATLMRESLEDLRFLEKSLYDTQSANLDLRSVKILRKIRLRGDPKQAYLNRESKVTVYYDSKLVIKAYKILRRMTPYQFLLLRQKDWDESRKKRSILNDGNFLAMGWGS